MILLFFIKLIDKKSLIITLDSIFYDIFPMCKAYKLKALHQISYHLRSCFNLEVLLHVVRHNEK